MKYVLHIFILSCSSVILMDDADPCICLEGMLCPINHLQPKCKLLAQSPGQRAVEMPIVRVT